METIETTLTRFRHDTATVPGKAAYAKLVKKLKAQGHRLHQIDDRQVSTGKEPKAGGIEIETAHLFADQWNTKCGFRVFGWFELYHKHAPAIRKGYYISKNEALREALRNTMTCGYCGKQEAAQKGNVFCSKCLDSEYLQKKNLCLLRMLPVEQFLPKRPELTEAELAHLLPQFIKRQTTGKNSRNAAKLKKQRADIKKKARHNIESAKTERQGMLWLMDNGLGIENVLYYEHKGYFGFGWRQPLDFEVVQELLEKISEFPCAYQIKGIDKDGNARTWDRNGVKDYAHEVFHEALSKEV